MCRWDGRPTQRISRAAPDSTGSAMWGGAYSILGDGVTATRGLMTQSAVTITTARRDCNRIPAYSARVRVRMTGALTQGTCTCSCTAFRREYRQRNFRCRRRKFLDRMEGIYCADYSDGRISRPFRRTWCCACTRTARQRAAGFLVENIEIFPTPEPYNTSLVRASFAEDPESYDGVSGFMNVSEERRADGARGVSAARAALFREGSLDLRDRRRWRERAGIVDDQRSFAHGGHAVGAGRGHRRRLGRDCRAARECTFSMAASR